MTGGVRRLVLENDVQCVDDSGKVAENGQQDVDEEVSSTATCEEDAERREEDGEDDLTDICSLSGHCERFVCIG